MSRGIALIMLGLMICGAAGVYGPPIFALPGGTAVVLGLVEVACSFASRKGKSSWN